MLIEICTDSVESALAAERGGAERVELCANLFEGGTTPSAGTILATRARIRIGLQILVRPRGGDFCYSGDEMDVIRRDIQFARQAGADGIVVGCLTPAGDVDREALASIIPLARPMNIAFHRAFDMCRDPEQALEELIALGIDRVLTSGQENSCLEGLALITRLNQQAAGRIIVMPGGGITLRNAAHIAATSGVRELHLSARGRCESRMEYRNSRVFMGGTLRPPEFSWGATDEATVRAVVQALG